MTKIAVSSEAPGLDSRIDPRFGRAAGFVIVDPETMAFDYIDNGSAQVMAQGAGIQAAESVSRAGATVVLTGFVGPKAFQVLAAAGISVCQELGSVSVGEAVAQYKDGRLATAAQSNRQGHWK